MRKCFQEKFFLISKKILQRLLITSNYKICRNPLPRIFEMIVEKIDEKNSIQHQIFGVQYTHSDETMNAIKVVERKKKRGIGRKI